jgi:HSP90 family molecular chaperone
MRLLEKHQQVAFFLELKFLDKYKDSAKDSGIIGHFGLGFYSAFMVAEKVEIITKIIQRRACCTLDLRRKPRIHIRTS